MPSPKILEAFGEEHAAQYDQRFAKMAPLREALHLMMRAILSVLPEEAHILCVGAGTGLEIAELAQHFPGWRFTAVEPAPAMLRMCRQRAESLGLTARCTFHEGYLDSLPPGAPFDGATSLLVSQFLTDREERRSFFRSISARLRPGGLLVSADLAGEIGSAVYERQLDAWLQLMMQINGLTAQQAEGMRAAYGRDVAILPPAEVAALIASSGFVPPTPFLQTLLIHAWFTTAA